MQNYFKIIAEFFNDIEKKMEIKNDEISVKEMFLQKIEKLKIIISLYKQDIYQAIVDLNFIYDNYMKFMEQKKKEMAKYLKKDKFHNNESFDLYQNKFKKINYKDISSIKTNRIYLYYIIICALFSIITAIIVLFIWKNYIYIYNLVQNLVESHGNFSNIAYKVVNYFQLMLYNSITIEDINKYENYDESIGQDIFWDLYQNLENLYEAKKYMSDLKQFNLNNIDIYFNFTCESFIDYLYSNNNFLKAAPSFIVQPYKNPLLSICQSANVYKSNNYKQIFSMFFESIQIGINHMKGKDYEELIAQKEGDYFPKITGIFLYVFTFNFEILGMKIQRQSFEKLASLINNYLTICFVIYYISSFIFLIIISIEYIYRFNNNYRKLYEIKKVFKICNKRE